MTGWICLWKVGRQSFAKSRYWVPMKDRWYFYHFQLSYERCKKRHWEISTKSTLPTSTSSLLNVSALWAYSISVLNPSNFVCLCVCFVNSQLISLILLEVILITTNAHNTCSLWYPFVSLVLISVCNIWININLSANVCDFIWKIFFSIDLGLWMVEFWYLTELTGQTISKKK